MKVDKMMSGELGQDSENITLSGKCIGLKFNIYNEMKLIWWTAVQLVILKVNFQSRLI